MYTYEMLIMDDENQSFSVVGRRRRGEVEKGNK